MKVKSLYMARKRFFVQEVKDNAAELLGFDARHLARVLRAAPGQRFEISDNRKLYLAEVSAVRPDRVLLRVLEDLPVGPPLPRITLIASMIKFDRFEWLIEKTTETGVSRIVPVEAERTEPGLLKAAERRLERWQRIARESSQQSRRVTMPEVAAPQKLNAAIAAKYAHKYRLEEEGGAPLLLSVAEAGEEDSAILIGPEGGWTDAERSMLDAAGWSAVWLGPTILRAETAAMVACAILAQAGFRNSGRATIRARGWVE